MFQIGESVVYGTTGVCTISAIGPLSMHGVDRKQQYYTLQPIHQEGAVYIPADGEKLKTMRYPLTKQQAEEPSPSATTWASAETRTTGRWATPSRCIRWPSA